MGRYVLAWFPMVLIAVGNGAAREAWLMERLGAQLARQVSTVMLIGFFTLYVALIVRAWAMKSGAQAAAVGAVWLGLTLGFEFALGRLVSGLTWHEMLAEYDLVAGRLWVLVPLWLALAPYVFYRLQHPAKLRR